MQKLCGLLMTISYWLGVVALILSVALRASNGFARWLWISPRGALLFAASLFLCTIASYAVTRLQSA